MNEQIKQALAGAKVANANNEKVLIDVVLDMTQCQIKVVEHQNDNGQWRNVLLTYDGQSYWIDLRGTTLYGQPHLLRVAGTYNGTPYEKPVIMFK